METVEEFAAQLLAAPAAVEPLTRAAVRATGEAVVATAKDNVDVLSGRTRDTISAVDVEELVAVDVGPETVAGPMLENGTATMPARPFLGPAADEHMLTLEELVGLAGVRALDS